MADSILTSTEREIDGKTIYHKSALSEAIQSLLPDQGTMSLPPIQQL